MPFLQRLKVKPDADQLADNDRRTLVQHFDPYAGEVIIDGEAIPWTAVDEVEVAVAARARGPAGWLVRWLTYQGADRYHVAFYYGQREAVLHNITPEAARHVVQTLAYYAPHPVRYTGPDGFAPLTEH